MKKLGLIEIMLVGLVNVAVANQANKIDDILSKINTTPKIEFSEEECTPELRTLTGCKVGKPSYDMPGGNGSLDRIIGRDPKTGKVEPYYKDVTKEEADVVRAKSAYKKAVKKSEIAKNKLEEAKNSGKGIDKTQEEYDDAIRDVELSKAKIKDLEEIAKESKKEK